MTYGIARSVANDIQTLSNLTTLEDIARSAGKEASVRALQDEYDYRLDQIRERGSKDLGYGARMYTNFAVDSNGVAVVLR